MKYAVFAPADQTIVYLAADGVWTTKHPDALLFADREEAQAAVDAVAVAEEKKLTLVGSGPANDPGGDDVVFLEDVPDEAEFRGREDTW